MTHTDPYYAEALDRFVKYWACFGELVCVGVTCLIAWRSLLAEVRQSAMRLLSKPVLVSLGARVGQNAAQTVPRPAAGDLSASSLVPQVNCSGGQLIANMTYALIGRQA